jgi:Raf kinase inhibitor-like YbhB/YbcL family protein
MKALFLIFMAAALNNNPFVVESPAFANNEMIPAKYTCTGSNINPALVITNTPKGTKSLALIVDDPDAPNGTFDHWVMWNIPVTAVIDENSAIGIQGKNGKGESKYTGPCPPSGTHHYSFKVYALDTKKLDLAAGSDKKALLKAMEKHILASGKLIGLYKK